MGGSYPLVIVLVNVLDMEPSEVMEPPSEHNGGWMTVTKSSNIPAQIDKYLCSIDFNPDGGGELAVGSSNLTTRYWNGGLFLWSKVEDALDIEKCVGGREIDNSFIDMKYIDSNRMILVEDSGEIEVLEVVRKSEDNEYDIKVLECEETHDGPILSLGISHDSKYAATGCEEACIKIWELDEFKSIQTYRPAHTGPITSLSFRPTDSNILLSSSSDGGSALWDTRSFKNVLRVTACGSGVTSSCWVPTKSNTIVEGYQDGSILMRDTRKLVGSFVKAVPHQRPVYKLVPYQHEDSVLVASCSDDCDVSVANITSSTCSILYKNSDHSDYVRGLAWQKSSHKLFSCGWDKKLISHNIPLCNS